MPGAELDYITKLQAELGAKWTQIENARKSAREEKQRLEALLIKGEHRFTSEDTQIVAFGSLAREEWTKDSDLDWTFLVDGQADPQHRDSALAISELLEQKRYKSPGRTGVFGNMAFSHDLIHHIGDQHDTSANITRRILLLLESYPLGGGEADTYSRIARQVFNAYFRDQWGLIDPDSKTFKVPLFLLNDVVRFWRTMAVEFAGKQRERGGAGFGLRNAKLRFSRKLIFAAGLLMCFGCSGVPVEKGAAVSEGAEDSNQALVNHAMEFVKLTPLEILAKALLDYGAPLDACRNLLDSYDEFLWLLRNADIRKHLETVVTPENAATDTIFKKIRDSGKLFQKGLEVLFFDNPKLGPLARRYGVF